METRKRIEIGDLVWFDPNGLRATKFIKIGKIVEYDSLYDTIIVVGNNSTLYNRSRREIKPLTNEEALLWKLEQS